jgi:predicted permease
VVTAWADKYVLQVALPAVIIAKISTVTFDADVVLPIAVAWAVMLAAIVAVLIASRVFNWSRSLTGALLLVGVLGNTSFLGLGMVESLLVLHCGAHLLQVRTVLAKVAGNQF